MIQGSFMDAASPQPSATTLPAPAAPLWPLAVLGIGVLLSACWSVFLGWSLYQVVQWCTG